ncbi:hypothetical protein ACET3Z_012517 [Daucus carota]
MGRIVYLLLVIIAASPLISSANPHVSSGEQLKNDEKVVIALYYETLCPYCSNLIVNYLYKYFEDGLDSIADLKLIPYGNAKIGPNNTIVCQHGTMECVLNTVESCAIHTWPDVKDHFPFIYCVESLVYEGDYDQWETCFTKLNLNPKPVMDCYGSGYGKKLELQYAAETDALEPRHTYVPWLVVDGQPLYDDYTDFISYVCKAYTGSNVPKVCQASLSSSTHKNANGINKVCYTEKATKTTLSKLVSAISSWVLQDNVAASI